MSSLVLYGRLKQLSFLCYNWSAIFALRNLNLFSEILRQLIPRASQKFLEGGEPNILKLILYLTSHITSAHFIVAVSVDWSNFLPQEVCLRPCGSRDYIVCMYVCMYEAAAV